MLKANQIRVLQHLRIDARKAFTKIGKETGIPTTTVYDHYKRLKRDIITRQVALLHFKNIGYHFNSFYYARSFNMEGLLKFLKSDPRINNLFLIDDYSVLFEAIFLNTDEKRAFLSLLEGFRLKELVEHPVVEELKREDFIPS